MNQNLKKILVCLGARNKGPAIHEADVREVTRKMVEAGFGSFLYGGGDQGLMGVFADECEKLGVRLEAIAPTTFANRELHDPDTTIVNSLFERKALMINRCDALLVLYGGIGTWDEFAEGAADNDIRRVGQPDSNLKPIFVLNRGGFWDGTFKQMESMLNDGYVHPEQLDMIRVGSTPEEIIDLMVYFEEKGLRPASRLNKSGMRIEDYIPRWKRTFDEQR